MPTTIRRMLATTALTVLTVGARANGEVPDSSASVALQYQGTYQFNLPAQSLADALRAIASKTALNIVFTPTTVERINAPAVKGDLTASDAIARVLAGTQLQAQQTAPNSVLVRPLAATETKTTSLMPADAVHSGDAIVMEQQLAQADIAPAAQTAGQEVGESSASAESQAAGSGKDISEIIVTAQKREERLQDVPVPVTAISGEALVSNNQLRLQDYYSKIPGLGLSLSGNGQAPVVILRGLSLGGATSPTVGIVIDDVSYGATVNPGNAPIAPDIDPGDLARVEVLRGPQGTLYGAASMGGLIKFVTIDPSTERFSGRVQAGSSTVHGGKDWGYSLRGSINAPLSDTLAVRASGFKASDPGYVDNVQSGARDVNVRDSSGGRLSMLWRPSEAFSLKLSAMSQDSHSGAGYIDTVVGGLRHAALRDSGIYDRDSKAYNLTMTGALRDIDVISITGYNVDNFLTARDFSALCGAAACNANFGVTGAVGPLGVEIEKFTQEVRATIPLGERFSWLLGAFYTDEDAMSHLHFQAANATTSERVGTLAINDQPSTFKEYAAFTNLTVDITERFDIQIGGRYSENRQTFSTDRSGPAAPALFANVLHVAEIPSKDDSLTYLVTPRFRLSPDFMVYARLASGYRPGGSNTFCGRPGVLCTYGPDSTENIELGLKGSVLDGTLSFDASLYRIGWKDVQSSSFVLIGSSPFAFVENAGEAKSQGIELSIETRPLSGLAIAAWGAWNNAELTEAFPAQSSNRGLSGDRLPYSSRFSGNLSIEQSFPLGAATGFLGTSVSYVGERIGSFRPATQVRPLFPAYTEVGLSAGVRLDTWSINAFINNVTDTRGILRSGLDSLAPTYITYIQPRTAGLSVMKEF